MSERVTPGLSGVAETLLLPLYARARESQRTDGVLHDLKAEQIVSRLDYDFDRIALRDFHQATRVMGTREFDRIVRGFLAQHPAGVVVHLGCGLDTRFERVDNGSVTWFDLDLPAVVQLRRELGMAAGPARYQLITGSAFDDAWLTQVAAVVGHGDVLVVAEGVLTFFTVEQVRWLVASVAEPRQQPAPTPVTIRRAGPLRVRAAPRRGRRAMGRRHPLARAVAPLRPARTTAGRVRVGPPRPVPGQADRRLPLPTGNANHHPSLRVIDHARMRGTVRGIGRLRRGRSARAMGGHRFPAHGDAGRPRWPACASLGTALRRGRDHRRGARSRDRTRGSPPRCAGVVGSAFAPD